MTESSYKVLTADQVSVGDELSELKSDVTATSVVLGAMASRDWRPMHHDKEFAINRNRVKDIFINTPNNAAWFERYITDWGGPKARVGRMKFKMASSVFPGDEMVLNGKVEGKTIDDSGCCWLDMLITVSVEGLVSTACNARVAIPVDENDNPWTRKGEDWQP